MLPQEVLKNEKYNALHQAVLHYLNGEYNKILYDNHRP